MIKYVIPVLVAVVAVSGIMAIEQQSLMIFGVVVMAFWRFSPKTVAAAP